MKTTTKQFQTDFNKSIRKEGQKLINEFFIIYSRFECALKVSGFVNGGEERVSANWETFAAEIRQNFENSPKSKSVQRAIDYLTQHPPRIQNFVGGVLGWRERIFDPYQPQINSLFISIRDTRNNLFHGGKFNGIYQEDISRNYILIKSAIELINHCLQLHQTVRQNFLAPVI